ncbi:MAG: AraC family transcriptional regulator [Clostridia bacterium]|nr:AraC family transcriptional regulator [Clostridia bacterium]
MQKNDVMIEEPRRIGEETEFFLQENPANSHACGMHIHNAVELLYVREGSYSVTLDNESYRIAEGDLILFCSGAIHCVQTESLPRNSYYVIKIPPSFFIGFSEGDSGARYAMRFALNRRENKTVWRRDELEGSEIKEMLSALIREYESERYASEVATKLKVMELLVAILRDGSGDEAPVNDRSAQLIYEVMSYVQSNFAEDIDEKELAKRFGMSYSYFSRSFKRVTGMTFKNFLNRTRVSKAEQFLFENGGSISEAAIACGYNSISYFISVYRSVTGITPYKAMRQTSDGKTFV